MKIKICCIGSHKEAQIAAESGASSIGLVSAMPSGPGVIDEATIAAIIKSASSDIETVLLSSQTGYEGIAEQVEKCRPDTVQLVDRVEPFVIRQLQQKFATLSVMEVLHVTGPASQHEPQYLNSNADFLLLDSGNPELLVKELGGTGRVHDWQISAQIVRDVPVQVYLAGGLNPNNVGAAIKSVRPYGVDVCSGVRSDGQLDAVKLNAFTAAARVTLLS